nr:hypothetical protein [uncultured Rhodopila sp.]
MTEQELARGKLSSLEAVTAFNAPVFQSYADITAAVRHHLGAAAASLFARPEVQGDEIAWTTDLTGPSRRWADLSPAERATMEPLRREAGESLAGLIATLRRSGTNTRSGSLSHLLETAMVIPGVEHLRLVGQQLVLTFWGFRQPGDVGLYPLGAEPLPLPPPPQPVARRRIWPWLLGLLALLLLGTAGWWWFTLPPPVVPVPKPEPVVEEPKPPPPPAPTPPPPPPEPKPPEPPPPEPPPPPPAPKPSEPPPPAPPPPPPPAPHADLPKQRWDQHDLSVLQGCWSLGREVKVQSYNAFNVPGEVGVARAGRLCLDQAGHGQESTVTDFPSGRVRCEAPVTATFGASGQLEINRPAVGCNRAQTTWLHAHLSCVRRDDSLAACTETGEHGSSPIEFRRAR